MSIRCALAAVAVAASATAATAAVGDAYAFNLRGDNTLFTFDPANPGAGTTTVASPLAYDIFAMDFNSAADTLYAIDSDEVFGTIDLNTGAFSAIATLNGGITPGTTVGGLRVDPTNETFYVATGADLFTLDTVTGEATLVGSFGVTGTMIDIAIDANGQMYGHNIGDDSLYSIDKNTGAATLIGPHGQAANFAQGMDFDYSTNTLYAAIYTGSGTGQFVAWNLNDGTFDASFDTTPWNIEAELAIRVAIPAPGAAGLLALGGLVATRRRR